MDKIWKASAQNNEMEGTLARSLNISPKLGSLLIQRQINTYKEAENFFRPSLQNLYNPFLMKGMQKAVYRIGKAIQERKKILLYGDYDVDGTTSVAIMYRYFHSFYSNIFYYLPNREKEGYGISQLGIDWAEKNGIELIIALDCGIKSNKEIHKALETGIDFLILDHHLPEEELPEAFSILNPKQKDCSYPFKFLSGCGIAYKCIEAYHLAHGKPGPDPTLLLDLVALSIACDMVEVIDENRILSYFGLKKINENPILGLKALIKTCAIGQKSPDQGDNNSLPISKPIEKTKNPNLVRFQEILFQLGPRINAAGRMGDAHRVVELFITQDEEIALNIALDLNLENNKRKEIEKRISEEALIMIQEHNLENKFTNVLFSPNWHKGLIGIVASRVIERHYAPTIILTESQGKVSGSARSVGEFNIYEALKDCGHLLEQYGGHAAAAGLSLSKENVEVFMAEFEKVVSHKLKGECIKPQIIYHEELGIEEINLSFYKILEQFAPFGPGNPVPIFLSRGVRFSDFKLVKESHLKIIIEREKGGLGGIGFGMGSLISKLDTHSLFDICYQLDQNTYRGTTEIQILVKDIKPQPTLWQN